MHQTQNFEEWMKRYAANRQTKSTPTHGRLYQQRSVSFLGPTVCLLNRYNQNIEERNPKKQREEELLSKIVLLALVIETLNEENRILKTEREQWYTFERQKTQNQIRELNQKLTTKEQQFNQKNHELQSTYKKQIQELRNKFYNLEQQNSILSSKVRQSEKQIEQIKIKIKNKQRELESVKLESSMMKQSIDMQRSRFQSQTQSNESLRGRLKRCEEINTDLKFIINGQKQQINNQKQKQIDLAYKYEIQIDTLRKQLNNAHMEYSKVQEQQNKKWHNQIFQLQNQVNHIEETLRKKKETIQKQTDIINEKENKCLQLTKKLEELENNIHSKIIKTEENLKLLYMQKQREIKLLNEERENCEIEIISLNSNILEMKHIFAEKELEFQQTLYQLLNKLKQKDAQLKKLKLKLKESELQPNINQAIYFDRMKNDQRLRAQSTLDQIFTTFTQLKSSNDRSTRLIQNKFKVGELSRN